jgi:drug/metabolite transporter (DMT)-like permease
MSLWIPVTLAAAFFQTLRFMLQKVLASASLSAAGATLARFFYSAPIVVVLVALYFLLTGRDFPELSQAFWAYGALGGASQILGTVLVVMLFKSRNFTVGITLKKTEVIQNVLFGLIILGEGVTLAGFLFICIGLVGVLLLSDPPGGEGPILKRVWNRTAALGLASGAMFGISGVAYRGASLELALDEPMLRAGITLAAVTSMQLVAMLIWLRLRDPGEIGRVWAARRTAAWVGLTSMAGSFCWFTAFTLQTAAYVNAIGQVELIFSMIASVLFFREKISGREFLGVCVLGLSVIGLVLVIPT